MSFESTKCFITFTFNIFISTLLYHFGGKTSHFRFSSRAELVPLCRASISHSRIFSASRVYFIFLALLRYRRMRKNIFMCFYRRVRECVWVRECMENKRAQHGLCLKEFPLRKSKRGRPQRMWESDEGGRGWRKKRRAFVLWQRVVM